MVPIVKELLESITSAERLVSWARDYSKGTYDSFRAPQHRDRERMQVDFEFVVGRLRHLGKTEAAKRVEREHKLRIELHRYEAGTDSITNEWFDSDDG